MTRAGLDRASPDVSIITPTGLRPERIDYLREVHHDLSASGVVWEWIICVDGTPTHAVPAAIESDPRVTIIRSGRQVGAAAARNLALAHATGLWTTSVDDDDRLPHDSLDIRLDATASDIGWVGGLLADLHTDALTGPHADCPHTVTWNCPAPRGFVPAGEIWRVWPSPQATFPVGPTTLLVRTDLLRAVGGWHGLNQGEDFGMVMAVTGLADGIMLDQPVYLYRKHQAQMTATPDFWDLEPTVREITYERGRLLASATWSQERLKKTA